MFKFQIRCFVLDTSVVVPATRCAKLAAAKLSTTATPLCSRCNRTLCCRCCRTLSLSLLPYALSPMLQHTSNSLLPCTASSLPPWALLLGTAHPVVVAAAHSSSRLAGPHPRRYTQFVSSHRHRRRCAGHCPACELRRWEEQRGAGQRGTGRRCRLVSFRVIAVLVGVA